MAFGASVILSALVIRSPACPLAQAAWEEFDRAFVMFEDSGSRLARTIPTFLDNLQRLRRKATLVRLTPLTVHRSSLPPTEALNEAHCVQEGEILREGPHDRLEVIEEAMDSEQLSGYPMGVEGPGLHDEWLAFMEDLGVNLGSVGIQAPFGVTGRRLEFPAVFIGAGELSLRSSSVCTVLFCTRQTVFSPSYSCSYRLSHSHIDTNGSGVAPRTTAQGDIGRGCVPARDARF
ncbi:hypothetical protein EXIGLDRAFT_108232 [Exidia glandulosa HHB12029]|uniref:Uncharacterized protein n=1 Tax=Exidia glandulosa HHB12029 TaxID=1314781 RepID=A0A165GRB9_EXIGL|nr:hypothetical protein EXIGLDRAFT_108232 [Exidia glandulosa HHB12029]